MADAQTLAAGPPAAGTLSLDTAYLSNNFASLAGTNTAAQASQTIYSYSAYSYTPPGGTVAVPGLGESSINGGSKESGWAGLSNTVKYVIYAAAGVVALLVLGLIIWLCVRKSKKRKEQAARQNARLTTRSSFASPMHERETMQLHTGNAFNYNNTHGSMDEYKEPNPGIFRTDTNYTNSSMEKNRYAADVQSVHSIPPVYSHTNGGTQPGNNARSVNTSPGDLSGATLYPGQNGSDDTHGNHENDPPVHQMLANINTSLSSFKPVPPPGSKAAVPPRVEEPSYPPRMQSHGAAAQGQDRSNTPVSARGQHPRQPQQQQQQQQRYEGGYQQQQQSEYRQEQYQPRQRTYSRNEPSQQQQRQPPYNSQNGPTSPSYSDGTSAASGRSRRAGQGDGYSSGPQAPAPAAQDYFSSPEGSANRNAANTADMAGKEPLSPTYQSSASASHRYRMPPQNRNQRAMSPPVPATTAQQAYRNAYTAFAEDNNYRTDQQYSAGRGNGYEQRQCQQYDGPYESQHHQQQQQYQNQSTGRQDRYYQDRQHQYQEEYSPPYNNYRQY